MPVQPGHQCASGWLFFFCLREQRTNTCFVIFPMRSITDRNTVPDRSCDYAWEQPLCTTSDSLVGEGDLPLLVIRCWLVGYLCPPEGQCWGYWRNLPKLFSGTCFHEIKEDKKANCGCKRISGKTLGKHRKSNCTNSSESTLRSG